MKIRVQSIIRTFVVLLIIAAVIESTFVQASDAQEDFSTKDISTATSSMPILHSYFDGTDTEEWTLYLGSLQNPGEGGSGGIGNGYLQTSPPGDSRTSYFVASAQYHGDWSTFTELRFEMWSYGGTYYTSGYSIYGDIYLENNGKSAQLLLPRRPAATWDRFIVRLDGTENWTFGGGATSLQEVLNNVTDFQLRAEYGVGVDHTGLDNVEIFGSLTTGLFSISGQVADVNNNPISNVTIAIPSGLTTTTDAQGAYLISGLTEGAYDLIASKADYHFWPSKLKVQVGPDATNQNFTEWICAQEVPLYLQGQPSTPDTLPNPVWFSEVYGNYPSGDTYNTIGRWGCKVSSDAMMISYFGSRYQPPFDTNPSVLNAWLRSHGGYDIGNGVRRSHVFSYARENGVILYLWDSISGIDNRSLDENLCSGRPAILKVKNPYGDHFVVATGKITVDGQSTYTIDDPAHGQTTLREHYSN